MGCCGVGAVNQIPFTHYSKDPAVDTDNGYGADPI